MSKNKTSISLATSYQEIGEYWDSHDLAEVWEQTEYDNLTSQALLACPVTFRGILL
jgi:hypothetical protein